MPCARWLMDTSCSTAGWPRRATIRPIAVLDSLSRLMPAVATREHLTRSSQLRSLLSAYARSEDLIRIGAYSKGADPLLDRAIAVLPELQAFSARLRRSSCPCRSDGPAELLRLLSRIMAFRFTLEAVLRYRQSLEEAKKMRLQALLARRAALQQNWNGCAMLTCNCRLL